LSGYRSREFYGASYTVKQNITMQDLLVRTNKVIQHEIDVTRHQLMRNGVELIAANASFCGPQTVRLDYIDGGTARTVTAGNIVIATGTDTTRDPHIPFDGRHIFTSDDVLNLERLPRTLAVVGAGVIGCEYASIFAALGVRVTLIDQRHRLLPFVDAEIVDTLCYHLRENRVTLPPRRERPAHRYRRGCQRRRRRSGQAAPGERQEHRRREGALFGRPHRRDEPPRARQMRHRLRRARPARGRCELPHRGAGGLRGR
jgi:pyruvate/2-oxoglutarate dehydrogenase complex dihydrolipoamide dehydrogenase (E3) component